MSIQFRCVHCRQLLGISNARAGTQADCPACGRSLRVPLESGGQSAPVRTGSPQIDAGLIVALEELAALSAPGDSTHQESQRFPAASSAPLALPVVRKTDHLRLVPIKPRSGRDQTATAEPALFESPERMFEQLANLPPATRNHEPSILNENDSAGHGEPVHRVITPVLELPQTRENPTDIDPDHANALTELAASVMPPPCSSTSDTTRENWSTISTQNRASWSLAKFLGLLGITGASFLCGLVTGSYRSPFSPKNSSVQHVEPKEQIVLKQTISPAVPSIPEPQAVELISGRVTFMDESGAEKPDSNALVLLLPSRKETELKLDASPLRDITITQGRTAVEAALGALGASVIRTDEIGQFRLTRRNSGPANLIIVSRHLVRKDDDTLNPDVFNDISRWFENPSQVIGRLAIQSRPLSQVTVDTIVPPFSIRFDTKK